jgi:orotate phosphoribosyltransferase-like protein
MRLPASVVEERDAQIYQAKNRGLSYREIAAKLNISQSTAHAGYLRQQSRLAKLAQEDAVNGIWSHLDKMDALERALWPLAKERKVKIVDPVTGAEAEETLPPDYSAIRELRGILGDLSLIHI